MEREGEKAPLVLPLLFLFYSDLSPYPRPYFVFSMWFYFLMPFSVLPCSFLACSLLSLTSCSFLGAVQLTLYTLCTHNQPNETQQQHFTSSWSALSAAVGEPGRWSRGWRRNFDGAHSGVQPRGSVCVTLKFNDLKRA